MKTFYDGPFENSLFTENTWRNKSAMIIIPHEDDEINLTGATIHNLLQHNIRVYVVFCTNSDRFDRGVLRVREGMASCQAMGVPDEDAIFLGYCNNFRIRKSLQFYNAGNDDIVVVSTRNLTETYCPPEKPEFCFLEHHVHHQYTLRNFRNDIKEVILKYQPDLLFTNDFDRHPDHRSFSLIIEEAIAEILQDPHNTYHPEFYKGFCYAGSYLGKRDFYSSLNLPGVLPPGADIVNDPDYDTDYPPYDWDKRVRLPVPRGYISRTLNGSCIYASIRAHYSQGLLHNAKRIINSDQVFWRRRTDSLSYTATVTVSSGDGHFLTNFKLADCPNVITKPSAEISGGTWIPSSEDSKKEAQLQFTSPQRISRIVLHGNVESESRVLGGRFTLSNGYSETFGELRRGAKPTIFDFAPQTDIQWVQITLTQLQGTAAGLNEVEIYAEKNPPTLIQFIKIMIDDTYAYDYWLTGSKKEIPLALYVCQGDGVTVQRPDNEAYLWENVNNGDFELRNNMLIMGPSCHEAILRVHKADTPEMYDQIVLHKKNIFQLAHLKFFQGLDVVHNRIEHLVKHRYYRKHIKEKDPNLGKFRE